MTNMPDTNDYLSQLFARAEKRLNETSPDKEQGHSTVSASSSDKEPVMPRVFVSGGRFDDLPSAEHDDSEDEPAETAQETVIDETETSDSTEEVTADVQEDDTDNYEEDLPEIDTQDSGNPITFSLDSETPGQPGDDPSEDQENVFNWNVSEDVENYLTPSKKDSIFSDIPDDSGRSTRKRRRAEKRRLKENTRQLMDRNSGRRRGCFSAFFHLILTLLLVALTILAVLYALQIIADITIIDINKILSTVTEWVSGFITDLTERF